MGIDMVRTQRSWSNVDYQCFSSLANIISICIELRKSELQAKEDRLALDNSEKILRNIYKNLPAGVELYDKDGYLVDINDKELEYSACLTSMRHWELICSIIPIFLQRLKRD